MAVLVVAYPAFSQTDYSWIQALRTQYDSQHPLIEPHFTIVFPTDRLAPAAMLDHVVRCTRTNTHFSFVLRCATIVKDSFSTKTHLFLVPDEGYSALVKLHDALYTHTLASELSLDVPYIPHITVGDHVDPNVLRPIATTIVIGHRFVHLEFRASHWDAIAADHHGRFSFRSLYQRAEYLH